MIAAFGWRSIFLINLPIGVAGLWLTRVYGPLAVAAPKGRTDVAGQVVGAIALGALTASVTQAGSLGWGSPWVIFGFVAAGVASAGFVITEFNSAHPMVPPAVFRDPVFTTAVAVGFAINFAFYGLIFVLSLFFQRVQGRTTLQTGLAFAPLTAVLLVVNLAAGRLNASLGLRRTLVAGLGLAALGYLTLLTMTASSQLPTLAPAFLVIGAGIAMATPAMMTAALASVHAGRSGIGSGVVNAARQVGGALGVALFGSLIGAGADFVAGLRQVIIVAALSLLITGAVAYVVVPARDGRAARGP